MKNAIIILILLVSSHLVFSQNYVNVYYQENTSIFNPAATGMFNKQSFSLSGAYIPSAPIKNNMLNACYDYKIDKINSGIGLSYTFENYDVIKYNSFNLNYSYQIDFGNEKVLSAGMSIEMKKNSIDLTVIDVYPNSHSTIKGDENNFDLNAGLMYKTPKMYFGIATTEFLESTDETLFGKNIRHYNIMGAYNFNISSTIKITPNFLYQTNFKYPSDQYCFSLVSTYKNKFQGGFAYKNNNIISFMAGINLKETFKIGYAMNFKTSTNSFNSHEIALGFKIN